MIAGGRPAMLAIEWTVATIAGLVLAHLAVEIAGDAVLGYALLFLLPVFGGAIIGLPVGVLQWLVLRRHVDDHGRSWIVFTLAGFVAAWTVAMIVAAALFVAPSGLPGGQAFLAFAIGAPIIGWSQSRVLRRWSADTRLWVVASWLGWTACAALEIVRHPVLPDVDRLAGRFVSAIAGYAVESSLGATLLGGALAGTFTGVALALVLRNRR